MTKGVIHIVNSQALGGGIGTVLNYLQEGLNQTGSYQSTVLKTHADDCGRGGYEIRERRQEGQFDKFIYSPTELQQELAQYDIIHIHGIPSYRILEALDTLREKKRCPKIVDTCHSSVKKELKAYTETAKGSDDGAVLEDLIQRDILNRPGPFCDTYWGSAIYRQERVMTLADSIQHMNTSYKREILDEYSAQANAHKHTVIYNGVKILPEEVLSERPKQKNLIYCGRFAAEKGIDELIEALPFILEQHPEATIKIVGGDVSGEFVHQKQEKVLRELQRQLGQEKMYAYATRIEFTGWISDKRRISELYDWCDFVIVPSKDESFCLTVAEALNHKRIPIMTETPSLRELYLEQEVGLGIDIDERNGLGIAKVVNAALTNIEDQKLDEMTEKGRELLKERYSLEKVLNEQLRRYDQLTQ